MRRTSNLLAYVFAALALLLCAWLLAARMFPSVNVAAVAPATPSVTLATEGPEVLSSLAQPAHSSDGPSVESSADAERSAPELPGVALSGRLAGLERPHRYDELRVVLWEKGTTPDCEDLAAARSHAGPVRVVQASEDGSFVFEGLAADGHYELCAGGARHMSLPMARTVTPGDGPLVLELVRVKGLRIELVDSHGAHPRALPFLVERGLVLSGSALNQSGTQLAPWEQELAGVPGTGCAARASPFQRLLVLRGPPEFLSLGPITSYIEIPGYAVESPTFWAPVVTDQLPTERIVLRQVASEWGTLELELTGPGEAIRAHLSEGDLLGEIWMAYDDGPEFSLPVLGPAAMRHYEGLPHGSLRWSFRSARGFVWPRDGGSIPLRVGGEPARVLLDLSEACGLLVRFDTPEQPDPLPFTRMSIGHERGQMNQSIQADRLPSLLLLLEPGEWRQSSLGVLVQKTEIFYMSRQFDGPGVRIEPGALATLELSSAPESYPPARR